MADVVFNVSNATTVDLYPADYFTFYAEAIVPANSTVLGLIDISLPLDGLSAVMTVFSMTVVRIHFLFSLYNCMFCVQRYLHLGPRGQMSRD